MLLVEELELAEALELTEELELLEELGLVEELGLAEEPELLEELILAEELELSEGTPSELFAELHPVNISIAPIRTADKNFFIMTYPFILKAPRHLPTLSANCVCAILTLLFLNLLLHSQNIKPIPMTRLEAKITAASQSGAPKPVD